MKTDYVMMILGALLALFSVIWAFLVDSGLARISDLMGCAVGVITFWIHRQRIRERMDRRTGQC